MSGSGKLPYFQFYVNDFASDGKVEAMTTCEVGAYVLLLCKAWHEDPPATIPDDDRVLARWARLNPAEWSECKQGVLSCWRSCGDGRLIQPRLRKEYDRLREISNKRKASAMQMHSKCTVRASDSESGSEGVPQGTSETPRAECAREESLAACFRRFWAAYSRKVGKADAERAFAKAARTTHPETLVGAADEFSASPKGKAGDKCPHPATWLNGKRWEDDRDTWWSYDTTPEEGRRLRRQWTERRTAEAWWTGLTDEQRGGWVSRHREWFPRHFENDQPARILWGLVHERGEFEKLAGWAHRESKRTEAA